MLPFRVLREARRELLEAALWYKEADGVSLARAFGDAYRQQLERARRLPQTGHAVGQLPADLDLDVRSFLLARFPYTLFVAALPAEIVVVAVAHQHRRPFYWGGRLSKVNP